MKVVLLGNYEPDEQESMQRFARLLWNGLQARGLSVEIIRPRKVFGGFGHPHRGLGKWFGYVDKMLVFPAQLRRQVSAWRRSPVVVHVCDQANAIYAPFLQDLPHLVTACDLLAIRCAAGEIAGQGTRWSGRRLQAMILRGLNQARRITCISEATRQDVLRLTRVNPAAVDVTPMGLNYAYSPISRSEARELIAALRPSIGDASIGTRPYLLHVGGNQWYKNRLGLLKIYQRLVARRPNSPDLVMAGKPFTTEMAQFVQEHQLQGRVVSLQTVGNESLRALYTTAELLVFPSLEEGFGWPIVEAQACGCRVLTTNKAPMTEVGGDAVFCCNTSDLDETVRQLGAALDESEPCRIRRIAAGLTNVCRFSAEAMIARYGAIYEALAETAVKRNSSLRLKAGPGLNCEAWRNASHPVTR